MIQAPALPRSTPEAQGIPSAAIRDFVNAVEHEIDSLHSFMLVRHGYVVAEGWWEPYRRRDPHVLFSLSKSFTSSAIGLLVAEGRLAVDDYVLDFFAGDAPPEPSANLKAMRVRHLLAMSTGHASDTTAPMATQQGKTWVQGFLAQPVEYEPGTHFLYNTGATYMLSAIVSKLTGGRMIDYLRPRLFGPLGIENPTWEQSPEGIDVGGWGLRTTTADIAVFGQMYLQQGVWRGRRILPASWIAAATRLQTNNGSSPDSDWEQGYGYQFWLCRHNAYRGDGAFGQYCVVMPEQDAVLAITSGLGDMQPPLNLVWKYLLPALGPSALADDPTAHAALNARLAGLRLPTPHGRPSSAGAAGITGKTFAFAPNDDHIEGIRFDFGADEAVLTIQNDRGEQVIPCGYNRWQRGEADLERAASLHAAASHRSSPWKLAASGAWTDEQTYTARLWWYETPFARTITCRFAGEGLTLEQRINVGFQPPTPTRLEGQVVV